MADYIVSDTELTATAEAVRQKGGTSALIPWQAGTGFKAAVDAIPSGGSGPQWELIGETTIALAEYTDTTTGESIDTGINIKDTDWAYGIVYITCDSPITTSTEWGMTVVMFGRYTSNSNLISSQACQQKGSATLSKAAMVTSALATNSYGVYVPSNTGNVVIVRKCHGTVCPKCRAGNYTVAVYGLKSL